jgi:hypothetical protein
LRSNFWTRREETTDSLYDHLFWGSFLGGIGRDQILSCVKQLENQTSPDWLGVPNNAESVSIAQIKMHQPDEDKELAIRLDLVK